MYYKKPPTILARKKPTVIDEETSSEVNVPLLLTMQHPLEYEWVLFFRKIPQNIATPVKTVEAWEDCVKKVKTFTTVEDFWSSYKHLKEPSQLSNASDYYFFKKGIRPMWEDENNAKGGRWLISLDKGRRPELDHYWLELLLAMIGEQFPGDGQQICGAVLNVRAKGDKIALWTRDCNNKDAIERIGHIVRSKLTLKEQQKIVYERHQDLQQKTCSTVPSLLYL